jgi:hypothetical protein
MARPCTAIPAVAVVLPMLNMVFWPMVETPVEVLRRPTEDALPPVLVLVEVVVIFRIVFPEIV